MAMIRMTIRSWTGAEWEGILLGLSGETMRVAVPGHEDAAELHCQGGQWFAENGDPVQIDLHAIPIQACDSWGLSPFGAAREEGDSARWVN